MSEEQLKAFIAKVKQDTTLQGKPKAASDGNSAIAIANEAGFPITAEDIDSHSTELSTKELESAVGGGKSAEGIADMGDSFWCYHVSTN
ncbi:MAG: Nif11-like leader peptide family natural product precursor [Prochlorococcus sp.]|nr:Nif11-like leader peptide family natural product precursor [Prochlorococcaceae cyanobacterium ETNP1_MAG_8]